MNSWWRKLDNTAKIFSLEERRNSNTFRLSVELKEKVDPKNLKKAIIKTLDMYPSYKAKIEEGFFWSYLEENQKEPVVEEEKEVLLKRINFKKNNDYLFKVTYFNNKINLDVFHVLTDGMGAINFLKSILYNYLNFKYHLKTNSEEIMKNIEIIQDEYLKNADKKLICKEQNKKAFFIEEKANLLKNKTYHYILNLEKFRKTCKKNNVSMTEYLTSIYIFSIYKTIYNKSSKKDIVVTVPIDLRKHYNVESFSNFFTCMRIKGDIPNNKNVTFEKILNQVHNEFKNKLTTENIKKYLARDVKLGTNVAIRLVPLYFKKLFIKYMSKIINQTTTTTLSNIGQIKIEEQYKKYINNIIALVSTNKIQKLKCTICSYENKLNIIINSNLVSDDLEKEFYELLNKYVGNVKLQNNFIKK